MSYAQAINNYTNSLNRYNQQVEGLLSRHKQDVIATQQANQAEKQTISTIGIPTSTAVLSMSLGSKSGKNLVKLIGRKLNLSKEQQTELETDLGNAESREDVEVAIGKVGKNVSQNLVNKIKSKVNDFIDRFRGRKYTQLGQDDEYDIQMEDIFNEEQPLIQGNLQLEETDLDQPSIEPVAEAETAPAEAPSVGEAEIQPAPAETAPAEEAAATEGATEAESIGTEIGTELAAEAPIEAIPVVGVVVGAAALLGSIFSNIFSHDKEPDPVIIPTEPNLSHPIYSLKG